MFPYLSEDKADPTMMADGAAVLRRPSHDGALQALDPHFMNNTLLHSLAPPPTAYSTYTYSIPELYHTAAYASVF